MSKTCVRDSKQWLNRYASTELRGTTIERSQNRQRKLDGIITWYFDHVMEALPLMLQIALLLLGCALSRYLWEINTTVASVVLGVTSAGVISYMFIVFVGTASESYPYQTPGSNALRYLWPKVQKIPLVASAIASAIASALRDALEDAFRESWTIGVVRELVKEYSPQWPRAGILPFLGWMAFLIPYGFASDVYHLGRAAIQSLAFLLVSLGHGVYSWLHGIASTPEQKSDQQTTVLVGVAVHFVDAPDIPGQSCPPINHGTPCNNDDTCQF